MQLKKAAKYPTCWEMCKPKVDLQMRMKR